MKTPQERTSRGDIRTGGHRLRRQPGPELGLEDDSSSKHHALSKYVDSKRSVPYLIKSSTPMPAGNFPYPRAYLYSIYMFKDQVKPMFFGQK